LLYSWQQRCSCSRSHMGSLAQKAVTSAAA
jgi:hypothetical protein